jgi:hypothetical protein
MPSLFAYFALAVFFLLVCILAVPSDDTIGQPETGPPLASGPALLVSPQH